MSEPERTVRERQDNDLPALAAVLERVHAHDGYPVEGVADPRAWLEHPHAIRSWTAVVDDAPVGQITLTSADPDDDTARIWTEHTGGLTSELIVIARLFVDPDHRTIGVGRKLMHAALDHARNLARPVALDVMAKDRDAIRLYERLGGHRLGKITHRHTSGRGESGFVFAFSR